MFYALTVSYWNNCGDGTKYKITDPPKHVKVCPIFLYEISLYVNIGVCNVMSFKVMFRFLFFYFNTSQDLRS